MATSKKDWIRENWRPMMAVAYMIIILFDFIAAPIMWSILQALAAGIVTLQWSPLTLISGGIFHAAMGAVLGISAFTRGQENIEKMRIAYRDGEDGGSTK